jgi:ribulose-bisphosphate carboxylase large chain
MKTKAAARSWCELPAPPETTRKARKSLCCAFYKHQKGFRWKGIKDEAYKPEGSDWSHIVRRVLVGGHGETAKFHVRYFEISSGGNSSLEKHRHEHVVICIRGQGIVLTGKKKRTMEYLDTLYISPDTPHQLMNPFREPFGFLCIVNARRDRPKLLGKGK